MIILASSRFIKHIAALCKMNFDSCNVCWISSPLKTSSVRFPSKQLQINNTEVDSRTLDNEMLWFPRDVCYFCMRQKQPPCAKCLNADIFYYAYIRSHKPFVDTALCKCQPYHWNLFTTEGCTLWWKYSWSTAPVFIRLEQRPPSGVLKCWPKEIHMTYIDKKINNTRTLRCWIQFKCALFV